MLRKQSTQYQVKKNVINIMSDVQLYLNSFFDEFVIFYFMYVVIYLF